MKKVMIFGTFDFLHAGHFFVFEEAKKLGDHLTVIVARDERVKQLKERAPVHTESERVWMLDNVSYIDVVLLGDSTDVYRIVKEQQPDVIALGYDQVTYTDVLEQKKRADEITAEIVRLPQYEHAYKSSMMHKKEQPTTAAV